MADYSNVIIAGMNRGANDVQNAKDLALRKQLADMANERELANQRLEQAKFKNTLDQQNDPMLKAAALADKIAPPELRDQYFSQIYQGLLKQQAIEKQLQGQQAQRLNAQAQKDLSNMDVSVDQNGIKAKGDGATVARLIQNPAAVPIISKVMPQTGSQPFGETNNVPSIPPLTPVKTSPNEINPDGMSLVPDRINEFGGTNNVPLVPSTNQMSDQAAAQQLPQSTQGLQQPFAGLDDLVAKQAAERQIDRNLQRTATQSQMDRENQKLDIDRQKAGYEGQRVGIDQGRLNLDTAKAAGEAGVPANTPMSGLMDAIAHRAGTNPQQAYEAGVPFVPREIDPEMRKSQIDDGQKQISNMNTALREMPDIVNKMQQFQQINAKTPTGPFENIKNTGIFKSPDFQTMESLSNELALKAKKASGADSQVSNFERQIYASTTVSPSKSKEANDRVIQSYNQLFQTTKDRADFFNQYFKVNKTLNGADVAWGNYMKDNPLLLPKSTTDNPIPNANRVPWKQYFQDKMSGGNQSTSTSNNDPLGIRK